MAAPCLSCSAAHAAAPRRRRTDVARASSRRRQRPVDRVPPAWRRPLGPAGDRASGSGAGNSGWSLGAAVRAPKWSRPYDATPPPFRRVPPPAPGPGPARPPDRPSRLGSTSSSTSDLGRTRSPRYAPTHQCELRAICATAGWQPSQGSKTKGAAADATTRMNRAEARRTGTGHHHPCLGHGDRRGLAAVATSCQRRKRPRREKGATSSVSRTGGAFKGAEAWKNLGTDASDTVKYAMSPASQRNQLQISRRPAAMYKP